MHHRRILAVHVAQETGQFPGLIQHQQLILRSLTGNPFLHCLAAQEGHRHVMAVAFSCRGQKGRQTRVVKGGKESRLAGQPGKRLRPFRRGEAGGVQFLERDAYAMVAYVDRLIDGTHPRAVRDLLDPEPPSDKRAARQSVTGGVGG